MGDSIQNTDSLGEYIEYEQDFDAVSIVFTIIMVISFIVCTAICSYQCYQDRILRKAVSTQSTVKDPKKVKKTKEDYVKEREAREKAQSQFGEGLQLGTLGWIAAISLLIFCIAMLAEGVNIFLRYKNGLCDYYEDEECTRSVTRDSQTRDEKWYGKDCSQDCRDLRAGGIIMIVSSLVICICCFLYQCCVKNEDNTTKIPHIRGFRV